MNHAGVAPLNLDNSRPSSAQPGIERREWVWLGQGLTTSLVAFFLLNLALGFALSSMLELLTPKGDPESSFSLWLLASGFFTVGLLLVPPAILAFYRFLSRNPPAWLVSLRFPSLTILLLSYPLILLGGSWLSTQTLLAYLLLPLFHIAAIGIPIAITLNISLKGLQSVSPQRKWGALSVGLTLSPFLIFVLEMLALILPLAILAFWVSQDPERQKHLLELNETLRQPLANPQAILNELQPYLNEPAMIFTVIFFAALVVPLIEEAVKPLGVWLLYRRTHGALDGFVSGALCGAGYALLESFLLGSTKAEWLFAILGRSGTAAIHIFTSALIGAALTTAWQRRGVLRLILAYLIGVFFHGVWNGFAILSALRSVSPSEEGFWSLPYTQNLAIIAPLAILLLACLALFGLWSCNQQIRKAWGKIGSILEG